MKSHFIYFIIFGIIAATGRCDDDDPMIDVDNSSDVDSLDEFIGNIEISADDAINEIDKTATGTTTTAKPTTVDTPINPTTSKPSGGHGWRPIFSIPVFPFDPDTHSTEEPKIPEGITLTPEIIPAPERKPVPEIIPVSERKPVPEIIPAPERKPVPEIIPAPERKPVPEIIPAPERKPIPEIIPVSERKPVPEIILAPERKPIPEIIPAPEKKPSPIPVVPFGPNYGPTVRKGTTRPAPEYRPTTPQSSIPTSFTYYPPFSSKMKSIIQRINQQRPVLFNVSAFQQK
ncbi:E3 ubiquitin-protein ligase RNF12-B [Microplitis demolitor]|uniref:E3 ubiquitin-protein ligase RNF12-B n=1 Tax=Microplitis demolitor TaxID=69319 RepID=UPI00235B70B4|nr:E3 ubiquitin-protein ligase RNF12-B [Microplitis demolitor]